MDGNFRYYWGHTKERPDRVPPLPDFSRPERLTDARLYIPSPELRDAVNVALLLGQPLLITGEPGTGKTQLAYSLASEIDLPGPLVFHTKTNSTASELFYSYDALRHFQDSQLSRAKPTADYVTFRALGLAILAASQPKLYNSQVPDEQRIDRPRRALVLIDEIDKAPRDLPNDVLDEIENMRFRVPELDQTFVADSKYRPVVIMTSNSEKDLPEPFLRRCVYHHIPFPGDDQLRDIVRARMGGAEHLSEERLKQALEVFRDLYGRSRKKKPGPAELLAWLEVLNRLDINPKSSELTPAQRDLLAITYSVLLKAREDLDREQKAIRAG